MTMPPLALPALLAPLPWRSSTSGRVGTVARAVAVLLLCGLAGCATIGLAPPPTTGPPLPRTAEPPAPKINLSGFPLAYRQGYADGCASATGPQRQDAERTGKDGNYSMGWQDGMALCKKKR